MPNVMVALPNFSGSNLTDDELKESKTESKNDTLPNIGGALCSTPQSLADAHY